MVDVTLPSLGESVTEGIITRWFKQVGEAVARDEALFEVSTDKVDSEMPSPAAGVLVQVLAAEGDTVETGARVAVIDETATPGAPVKAVPAAQVAAAPTPSPSAPAAAPAERGVVTSPVVRRILADGGVEPSTVRGTGVGGAITRRDAERAVAQGPTEELIVALSNARRRMGQHMAMSALGAPHGFVAVEVDGAVFARLDARGRTTSDGWAVTDEMVVTVAAVRALSDFDFLNATLDADQLIVHRSVNVGVVRSIEGDGMLVPVVHAAARLTLSALARRVGELDERLASHHLTTDDLMGATFTVMGAPTDQTVWSVPIIIAPQVAVLSAGAVRSVPVVVREDAEPTIVVGRRLVLGLSFDHRVCDAAAAAAYLTRVGEILGSLDPESEL